MPVPRSTNAVVVHLPKGLRVMKVIAHRCTCIAAYEAAAALVTAGSNHHSTGRMMKLLYLLGGAMAKQWVREWVEELVKE